MTANVARELRYHVPRSQVWERSRGAQTGKTHVHVREPFELGRIRRPAGAALCGRAGWYERPPEGAHELAELCPRCLEILERFETPAARFQRELSVKLAAQDEIERGDRSARLLAIHAGTYRAGE